MGAASGVAPQMRRTTWGTAADSPLPPRTCGESRSQDEGQGSGSGAIDLRPHQHVSGGAVQKTIRTRCITHTSPDYGTPLASTYSTTQLRTRGTAHNSTRNRTQNRAERTIAQELTYCCERIAANVVTFDRICTGNGCRRRRVEYRSLGDAANSGVGDRRRTLAAQP